MAKKQPEYKFVVKVRRVDGSVVKLDDLPPEEQRRIIQEGNRRAVVSAAQALGFQVEMIPKTKEHETA
jgi:hypothetical protein